MAIISFTTTFSLGLTPSQLNFTDTSNYSGQGISTTNVNGEIQVIAPSGTIIYPNHNDYTNAGCDIWIANSLNSQQTIQLPLNSNGEVEPGTYTILYTVFDKNLNIYYTQTNTVNFQYTPPKVCINQDVDCISPLFISTDNTDYTVNGIFPTISGTQTLAYPFGSDGYGNPTVLPFTSNGSQIAVSTFYAPGDQTTQIEADLLYTIISGANGFFISDSITGLKNKNVDCAFICSIVCCLRSIERERDCFLGNNNIEYDRYNKRFIEAISYASYAKILIECGISNDLCHVLEKIKTITRCNDECKCSSDQPSRVVGFGNILNNVIVQSGGDPVIVTPVTIGTTTTYTVTLSSAFITLINSHYNTIVGGRNFVTVSDSGIISGTRTFVVDGEETNVFSSDSSIDVTQIYSTSGTLIPGLKYQIVTYVATDNFSNIATVISGIINTSGCIFLATGTTPTTWSHGSSLNIVGDRILNISKNLRAARNETDFNTPFTVTDANNQTVTGAALTVAAGAGGLYDIVCEADLNNSSAGIGQFVVYRIVKTGHSALNLDRVVLCSLYAIPDSGTPFFTQKIVSTALVTLAAGDVVNLDVDSNSTNFTIAGRSIKIIKVG